MRTWLSVLALSVLLVIRSAEAMPDERDEWTTLQCGHLRVISALSGRDTKRIAERLVQFRSEVFHSERPISFAAPSESTKVFLFRKEEEMEEYEKYGYAAWWQGTFGMNYLILRQERWEDSLPLALSMGSMMALDRGYSRIPPWVKRGLGEFYSSYRRKGDKIRVGRATDQNKRVLHEYQLLPWSRVVEIGPSSPELHSGGASLRVFDTQAWALLSYLIVERNGGEVSVARYLASLESGVPSGPAFFDAFGLSVAEALQGVEEYRQKSGFSAWEFARPEITVEEPVGPEPLPYPVLLAELAEMAVSLGSGADDDLKRERQQLARSHLEAALARDPSLAIAHRGLGWVELSAGRWAQALPHLREAVALDPDDPRSRLLLADAIWGRFEQRKVRFRLSPKKETPAEIEEMREHLFVCLGGQPDLLEAHVLLGKSFLHDPRIAAPGISELQAVLMLQPGRGDARWALIALHLRNRETGPALDVALGGRRDDDRFERNVLMVVDTGLGEAGRALNNGNVPAAEEILGEMLSRLPRESLPEKQAEALALLESGIARAGG